MRDSSKLLENLNNSTETKFELNKSENIIIRIETSLMVLELYKGLGDHQMCIININNNNLR